MAGGVVDRARPGAFWVRRGAITSLSPKLGEKIIGGRRMTPRM